MNDIKIDNMSINDLELLKDSLITDFDNFWSISTLESEINNPDSLYIVAKNNDNILGFAGIWKSVDDVHIMNIVVKKDFRKNGIGSLLLEKLIEIAKNLGFSSITLEVDENNIPAQKLYLKYNFKNLGIRKNYYHNGNNAIIMTLFF